MSDESRPKNNQDDSDDKHPDVQRPEVVDDDHLVYLDALRESGVTNMFGASAYLQRKFGVGRQESHTILAYWMKTFGERHPR